MPQRKRLRLMSRDYSEPGAYFVTLVTESRSCVFGEVVNSTMMLNRLGEIVTEVWCGLPQHLSHVDLDQSVLMPNHLHGLVILRPGNQRPLSSVVRSFKIFSGKAAARTLWQRGFHDRIVRNDEEMARIREYIANNPAQWAMDRENPASVG